MAYGHPTAYKHITALGINSISAENANHCGLHTNILEAHSVVYTTVPTAFHLTYIYNGAFFTELEVRKRHLPIIVGVGTATRAVQRHLTY